MREKISHFANKSYYKLMVMKQKEESLILQLEITSGSYK